MVDGWSRGGKREAGRLRAEAVEANWRAEGSGREPWRQTGGRETQGRSSGGKLEAKRLMAGAEEAIWKQGS